MDYALSLQPDYHRAILDVIKYYAWDHIIYIYDSHDGKTISLSFSFLDVHILRNTQIQKVNTELV